MKMKAYMTVLCLLATALAAWAGELTPVACEADLALGIQPVYVDGAGFKPGQAGSGLVSSLARVAAVSGTGWVLQVAIDSSTADAKAPDVVRLDFTGKGNFAGAPTAALKPTASSEGLFQAIGATQRRGPPDAQDLAHRLGNGHGGPATHFLLK